MIILFSSISIIFQQIEIIKDLLPSKRVIEKLKRFKMTDKYCINNSGSIEQTICSICISDIKEGEETILLPCGHMYHSKCVVEWLNQNNACRVTDLN
jgi:hypothetical protein